MSQLEALAKIIANGVQGIEAKCAERGVAYPTPDVVCTPETDKIQNELSSDATPIIAAAYQLIATLSHPQPFLLGMGLWVRSSGATIISYGTTNHLWAAILPRRFGSHRRGVRT